VRSVAALAAMALTASTMAAEPVTPASVAARIGAKSAPYLLDVRTPAEFAEGHVPGAVNIPVQALESRAGEVPTDREVVVYCASGARATRAARMLAERGYGDVHEMTGSLMAWREAGFKVER
jgi:phage shock protein E